MSDAAASTSGAGDPPRNKKDPEVKITIGTGTPGQNDGPGDGAAEDTGASDATCPNCGCVFTGDGDVLEEGAPVAGGESGYDAGPEAAVAGGEAPSPEGMSGPLGQVLQQQMGG